MKAKYIRGTGSGGTRIVLEKVLPLDTPFGVDVFPIHACNFRCKYCLFSLPKDSHEFGFETDIMPYELYEKCVNDMSTFPKKIKMIRFVGIGEPLLHKDIDKMVEYTVKKGVAEQTEIITNGALLTHDMSDRLIDAGLGALFISIQGITEEDYKEVADVDIKMEKFLDNIQYFYNRKVNTKLSIKIIDCGLKGREDEFFRKFGDICDIISIENASPLVSKVDYTNIISQNTDETYSVRGHKIGAIDRCSFPFYLLQINPDGTVYPCCSAEALSSLGDCRRESLVDIWNGKKFNNFRKKMLVGTKYCGEACYNCQGYKYAMFQEDIISNDIAQKLLDIY